MKENNIENVFSSLENLKSIPPPEMWDAIEQQLEQPKKKKRGFIWWSIAASLVVGLSIPFVFDTESGQHKNNSIKNTNSSFVTTTLLPSNNNEITPNKADAKLSVYSIKTSYTKNRETVYVPKNDLEYQNKESENFLDEKAVNNSIAKNILPNTSLPKKGGVFSTKNVDSTTQIALELKELEAILAQAEKNNAEKETDLSLKNNRWSLQVFAGLPNTQNNKQSDDVQATNNTSNTFGVKTNYQLNSKWAITTGLKLKDLGKQSQIQTEVPPKISTPAGYSVVVNESQQLPQSSATYNDPVSPSNPNQVADPIPMANVVYETSSSMTTTTSTPKVIDKEYKINEQKEELRFVEIPLEISYSVLEQKRANIRLNTGGMLGKLVSNKAYLNGNAVGETQSVNEYIYGVLFSTTLQYKIFKQTYMFAEPGMNYYMKSFQVKSINQVNPTLNMGVNVRF